MLETIALGRGFIELDGRFGKAASGAEEKPKREQRGDRERDQEVPKPAIFAIPVHGSFTGFLRSRRNS